MSHTQPAPAPAQPTLINMPQPSSNPDTPSEMPGTPTSTTTSLSALSTTAIKDGQRGGGINSGSGGGGSGGSSGPRGHHYHSSANSLEAERADRISRLTGLSTVSTLRAPRGPGSRMGSAGRGSGGAPLLATPPGSSSSFSGGPPFALSAVPGPLTPAFFDAHGQPMAITKMSTVGTASATASTTDSVVSGHTLGTIDDDDDDDDDDEDNEDIMLMDDDNLDAASRSAGVFEDDRMSNVGDDDDDDNIGDDDDDGSASLVGFGEGAGSTISGPIYQRRGILGTHASSSAGAMAASTIWAEQQRQQRRLQHVQNGPNGLNGPNGQSLATSSHQQHNMADGPYEDDVFVDAAARGTGPPMVALAHSVIQAHPSALRETQRPRSHQQQQQQGLTRERVAAEQILRSLGRLDGHERSSSSSSSGQDHYQAYQAYQLQQQQLQNDPAHYHYNHQHQHQHPHQQHPQHGNSGSTGVNLASPSRRINRRSARLLSDERR